MLKHLPNTLTCLNLTCGVLGIIAAMDGDLVTPAVLIAVAAILDFFDGFAARMLKAYSVIGKDLDSLADMVTFGVLPGIIMFNYLVLLTGKDPVTVTALLNGDLSGAELLPFSGLLIPVFSALRLAKFNNDTRQSESFIGVPTPANTMLLASLPLIVMLNYGSCSGCPDFQSSLKLLNPVERLFTNIPFLVALIAITSFLLVAELPLFALKFKNFKWRGNEIRFIFLVLCLGMLIIFKILAIPFIIILYILLSVVNNFINRDKEKDYDLIAKK